MYVFIYNPLKFSENLLMIKYIVFLGEFSMFN